MKNQEYHEQFLSYAGKSQNHGFSIYCVDSKFQEVAVFQIMLNIFFYYKNIKNK